MTVAVFKKICKDIWIIPIQVIVFRADLDKYSFLKTWEFEFN